MIWLSAEWHKHYYFQHNELNCITQLNTFLPHAVCLYAECPYAECAYAECPYAECPYAECHWFECCGAERNVSVCFNIEQKLFHSPFLWIQPSFRTAYKENRVDLKYKTLYGRNLRS